MKYLGVDYGAKRVGVAISNDEGTIAFPRATIANDEKLVALIVQMIEEEKIGAVVVGDTRTVSGAANPISAEADAFIEELERVSGVSVKRSFEGWSYIEASRYAPRGKEHDDAAAAAIILQRFLDMHKSPERSTDK